MSNHIIEQPFADNDGDTEIKFEKFLAGVLGKRPKITRVETFKQADVATLNRGLCVTFDGRDFELTIVEADLNG